MIMNRTWEFTQQGKTYTVQKQDGQNFVCDCPDFLLTCGNKCLHIVFVEMDEALKASR